MADYKSKGDFIIFAAPIPEGADPKSVGVDFKKQNGFMYRGPKSLFGMMRVGEQRFKIMIVANRSQMKEDGTPTTIDDIPG